MKKTCRKCGVALVVGENYLQSQIARQDYICRPCRLEYQRPRIARWQRANPEKASEATRRWRENNRDAHRDASRRWKEANKEKSRQYARDYYAANADTIREKAREKARENRALLKAARLALASQHETTPPTNPGEQ